MLATHLPTEEYFYHHSIEDLIGDNLSLKSKNHHALLKVALGNS